jgi:hypothetical protein
MPGPKRHSVEMHLRALFRPIRKAIKHPPKNTPRSADFQSVLAFVALAKNGSTPPDPAAPRYSTCIAASSVSFCRPCALLLDLPSAHVRIHPHPFAPTELSCIQRHIQQVLNLRVQRNVSRHLHTHDETVGQRFFMAVVP